MPANLPLSAILGRLLDWAAPSCAAWCWARAVAVAPRSSELHFSRAQALARLGRWREAARSYAMAAHLEPANVECQGSLVLALERAGATEAALEALRRFAELRPGDGEIHVLIGTLQRRCGRTADALRSFRLAVALGRKSSSRRFLLGEMLLGAERWEEALAVLGLARDTGEAEAPPRPLRSVLNFQPRRPTVPASAQTRAAPRRLIRFAPSRWVSTLLRPVTALVGRLQQTRRRFTETLTREQRLRAIRSASRQLRRGTGARDVAAFLCALLGAAVALSAAPEAAPVPRHETAAAREQARLCERVRGEDGARACRAALALGIAPARRPAIRQQLALHLVALQSWEELAELYRDAVRQDPGDGRAWQRLGTTQLYALGAPVEALGALREAARLAPAVAETHLALGIALASLGRPAEAASAIERAVALDTTVLDSRPAARAILEAARQGKSWP